MIISCGENGQQHSISLISLKQTLKKGTQESSLLDLSIERIESLQNVQQVIEGEVIISTMIDVSEHLGHWCMMNWCSYSTLSR